MKNLFDFATKELSQDAFIRWLVENWNDSEDKKLQNTALDFLDYLCGEKLNLDLGKALVKTYSQVSHIDICIDIFPDKAKKEHYTIIIEDKVDSSEHNQLLDYNETVKKWTNLIRIFKVFYKTNLLSDTDKKGIEIANNNKNEPKWVTKDIKSIAEFFNKQKGSNSQILNNYIEYVAKLRDAVTKISDEKAETWSTNNWTKFFDEKMQSYKINDNRISVYVRTYRKIYDSLIISFQLKNRQNRCMKYAAFEIQVRDELKARLHPEFLFKKKWYWSYNDVKETRIRKAADTELNDLRTFIENKDTKYIIRGNTVRAFGRIKGTLPYKELYAEQLWTGLSAWIDEFLQIMKEYDK